MLCGQQEWGERKGQQGRVDAGERAKLGLTEAHEVGGGWGWGAGEKGGEEEGERVRGIAQAAQMQKHVEEKPQRQRLVLRADLGGRAGRGQADGRKELAQP
jgi:hypothetical protein